MFNPTATRGPCTFRSGPLLARAHTLGHQYVRNHWDTKGPGPQMRPDVGQRHSRWPDGCGCGAGDPRVLGEVSEAELNVGRLWHAESLVPYCWFTSFHFSSLPPTGSRLWSMWACCTSPTPGCGLSVALFRLPCSFGRLAPRVSSAWGFHLCATSLSDASRRRPCFPRPFTAEHLLDKHCLRSNVVRGAVGYG